MHLTHRTLFRWLEGSGAFLQKEAQPSQDQGGFPDVGAVRGLGEFCLYSNGRFSICRCFYLFFSHVVSVELPSLLRWHVHFHWFVAET